MYDLWTYVLTLQTAYEITQKCRAGAKVLTVKGPRVIGIVFFAVGIHTPSRSKPPASSCMWTQLERIHVSHTSTQKPSMTEPFFVKAVEGGHVWDAKTIYVMQRNGCKRTNAILLGKYGVFGSLICQYRTILTGIRHAFKPYILNINCYIPGFLGSVVFQSCSSALQFV
jgi:hypothetical protein